MNRPVECKLWKRICWYYNMCDHFLRYHPDHPREEWTVKNDERVALSKF